jgi:hypothetical protein
VEEFNIIAVVKRVDVLNIKSPPFSVHPKKDELLG